MCRKQEVMQLANVGLCCLENVLLQQGLMSPACNCVRTGGRPFYQKEFLKPGKCLLCDFIVTLRVYLGHSVSPLSPFSRTSFCATGQRTLPADGGCVPYFPIPVCSRVSIEHHIVIMQLLSPHPSSLAQARDDHESDSPSL